MELTEGGAEPATYAALISAPSKNVSALIQSAGGASGVHVVSVVGACSCRFSSGSLKQPHSHIESKQSSQGPANRKPSCNCSSGVSLTWNKAQTERNTDLRSKRQELPGDAMGSRRLLLVAQQPQAPRADNPKSLRGIPECHRWTYGHRKNSPTCQL